MDCDIMMNFSAIDRGTFIGKVARWPLSLIPSETRLPILQGTLRGCRWIVGSSNHGCWLGSYEREHQAVFEKWIGPGDVVFDIGAHVGFYTLLGSILVGERGRVVAFEPVPGNLDYLKRHLEMNSIQNVAVIEAAVSEKGGHQRLASGPSSSMWRFEDEGELNVRTVGLDELVYRAEIPPPDFVKMDIEGAEHLALIGASKVICEHHPVFALSTHGRAVHRSCCDFLQSAGYDLTPIGAPSLEECPDLLAVPRASD